VLCRVSSPPSFKEPQNNSSMDHELGGLYSHRLSFRVYIIIISIISFVILDPNILKHSNYYTVHRFKTSRYCGSCWHWCPIRPLVNGDVSCCWFQPTQPFTCYTQSVCCKLITNKDQWGFSCNTWRSLNRWFTSLTLHNNLCQPRR